MVLNDCLTCRGRRFFIEPDDAQDLLLMGCYQCGNHVDIPLSRIAGFSLRRWQDPLERGSLYKVLAPLYEHWNLSNAEFDWRGSNDATLFSAAG